MKMGFVLRLLATKETAVTQTNLSQENELNSNVTTVTNPNLSQENEL